MIRCGEGDNTRTICFSGDIGRYDKPILRDPASHFDGLGRDVDLMIMESTYGNREHEPVVDLRPRLKKALNDTFDQGGSVLIPSFAYGRTQELLYVIHELYDAGEVPRMPVLRGQSRWPRISPRSSVNIQRFTTRRLIKHSCSRGKNPFAFRQVQFVESVEASHGPSCARKNHTLSSPLRGCVKPAEFCTTYATRFMIPKTPF